MGNPVGTTYEEEMADERNRPLDGDHFFRLIAGSWSEGRHVGALVGHRCADGVRACVGYVSFERPPRPSEAEAKRPLWEVLSWEPLTISPSVQCSGEYDCGGTHGFIREGRWVPA